VADIVVRALLGMARADRQQRLRSVQGLHLRLLFHSQHYGAVRRIPVEAYRSRTLSTKSGSVESLMVWVRWGWSPTARQIRDNADCR